MAEDTTAAPEATASPEEALRAACAAAGLDAATARPLAGGQLNRVWRVGGQHVLRLGSGEEARRRLRDEAAALALVPPEVPAPRLTARGEAGGWIWRVHDYVAGEPLHHAWPRLTASERDAVMGQVADALQILHAVPVAGYGPPGAAGGAPPPAGAELWRTHFSRRYEAARRDLLPAGYPLPEPLLRGLERALAEHAPALDGGDAQQPVLVHGDLWPGNLLVREGRLAAILDWELATGAPRDYELLLVEHYCLYPNDFCEEGWEIYAAGDWGDYARLLSAHYPALTAGARLRERLDLYQLQYVMEVYAGWAREFGAGESVAMALLAKAANFLTAHGARIFASR